MIAAEAHLQNLLFSSRDAYVRYVAFGFIVGEAHYCSFVADSEPYAARRTNIVGWLRTKNRAGRWNSGLSGGCSRGGGGPVSTTGAAAEQQAHHHTCAPHTSHTHTHSPSCLLSRPLEPWFLSPSPVSPRTSVFLFVCGAEGATGALGPGSLFPFGVALRAGCGGVLCVFVLECGSFEKARGMMIM